MDKIIIEIDPSIVYAIHEISRLWTIILFFGLIAFIVNIALNK